MPVPLRVCLELPHLLARHGVRFGHWKSNHHLDAALAGETDLDLLVCPDDAAAFRRAMAEAGALRIVSQPWATYPGVEDWLLTDADTGAFVHLHVHEVVTTGLKRVKHLTLPWTETVLRHLREEQATGWPIPEPELELLILLIRMWAKMPPWRRLLSPTVPSHLMAELRWLEDQSQSSRVHAVARELGISADAYEPDLEAAALLKIARSLNRQVRQHYRMSWPRALLRSVGLWLRLVSTRIWLKVRGPIRYRKVFARRGALVAVIGSDGSGKSTLSSALSEWLRYKLDVHLIYMGSGQGAAGWLNGAKRTLAGAWRRQRGGNQQASLPRSESKRSGFAGKCYRLFDLLLLRRKLRYLRLGRNLADGGSVILCDRYPQNQFEGINDGPRQQQGRGFAWAARMELRLLDEALRLGPDVVLRLHIDPETALCRKPNHNEATIRRKCIIVDALDFPHANDLTIDAALPQDSVALAAKTGIWSYLQEVNAP